MSISKVLSNGLNIVVKTSGKQTLTQVFDEAGNLIKTRIKSVEKSIVPPIKQKKIGFTVNSGTDSPSKNIFTIAKNEYNHTTRESTASIIDRVYINSERVGERIISANGNGNAMTAMNSIKEQHYDTKFDKILRFFKDGKIAKENKYEFEGGKRRSRYNVNFELEKEIESLETKVGKIKYNNTEPINKELSNLESEIEKIKASLTADYVKVEKAEIKYNHLQNQINNYKKEQQTIQTINKLLTQEFHTDEEFKAILKEVKKIQTKDESINYHLDIIETDYLCNYTNISDWCKNQLKSLFRYDLKTDYEAIISEIMTEAKAAKKEVINAKRVYSRQESKANKRSADIIEQKSMLEKELKQKEIQNKKLDTKRAKLKEQIKQLEAKRKSLILDFNGTSLRADIDGIDFTL